ncbi:MAG: hypothetical protein JWP27_1623, partial [Flaviaesturariibacter sp.]|nr:hypothetical protein [Flaviaesturariibacter sp.]
MARVAKYFLNLAGLTLMAFYGVLSYGLIERSFLFEQVMATIWNMVQRLAIVYG